MVIYILVILFLFLVRESKARIWIFLSFLILFVLAAFRDLSVGTDAMNYLERYDYVDENSDYFNNVFIVRGEFFESLLYITGHRLSLSYRTILGIESFLFLLLVFLFFKKRLQHPLTGILIFLLLYYYFSFFNIFRNIMALSVIMYGYLFVEGDFIKKESNIKAHFHNLLKILCFIGIVILGSMVHQSVLVLLLLLPMKYIKFDIKLVLILSVISLLFGFLFDASSLLNMYTNLFEETSKYSGYVKDVGSHFVIAPILELVFIIVFYLFYNKKLDLPNNIYFKAWVFEYLFLNAFGFASTYGSRIVLSYAVARCVLFADSLSVKNKNGSIVVFLYLLYSITRNMIAGYDGVIPYKFMPL